LVALEDLSIAIMTHNEMLEFSWLMDRLAPILPHVMEVIVVDDYSDDAMIDLIKRSGAKLFQRKLNKDFSAQRNYMKGLCSGKYILVLDPDELPTPGFLGRLGNIIALAEQNKIDICSVPRLNIIHDGLAPQHDSSYRISDEQLQKQRADHQPRIIRNGPDIRWMKPVHERVVGAKKGFKFPDKVDFAIVHIKHRARARAQNQFYDTIATLSPVKFVEKLGIKPAVKRLAGQLGLLGEPVWINFPEVR
jgi:glycosyltransferase involved in cell wall biosynthesis